jgi:hypothetical protein
MAKLPQKFASILQAKHLAVHIFTPLNYGGELSRRLSVEKVTTASVTQNDIEYKYKNECDIWSKLEWNARYGLPKPVRMIAESSAPELCEYIWQFYARNSAPMMSHFIAFLDEDAETEPASARLLALVPLGIADKNNSWSKLLLQATQRDLIRCALSPNNAFLNDAWTYSELAKISTTTTKKDEWGYAPSIDYTKSANMAEYMDTLVHKYRYSASVRSYRVAEAEYQQFLAWSDTARGIETAPFRLVEADTAAMVRLREMYSSMYGSNDVQKMEKICSNTQEIKKYAAQGKEIPVYLTREDDAENECYFVAGYYKRLYETSNIGRVLVAFATKGEREGLPAFAICIGATRLDSTTLASPLSQQIRAPKMSRLLSVESLQNVECEQIEGECPVRGSMTTEYRTLYDYCTMKTRQGVFRERTSEVLGRKE